MSDASTETFAELFEQTQKTLKQGEVVRGKVLSIDDDQIQIVDTIQITDPVGDMISQSLIEMNKEAMKDHEEEKQKLEQLRKEEAER